jgi:hypothetical protein
MWLVIYKNPLVNVSIKVKPQVMGTEVLTAVVMKAHILKYKAM